MHTHTPHNRPNDAFAALRGTGRRAPWRIAFTTIELLVSIAILVITLIATTQLFNISSDAAGKTAASAKAQAAAAAFRTQIAEHLGMLTQGGMLIIESPPPTEARVEIKDGVEIFRLRHDRLVFLASGDGEAFQSITDPARGRPNMPDLGPITSSEALVYYGPAVVVPRNGFIFDPVIDPRLTASDWVYANRAILLTVDNPTNLGWSPPGLSAFTNSSRGLFNSPGITVVSAMASADFLRDYTTGAMDVVHSVTLDNASTAMSGAATGAAAIAEIFQQINIGDILTPNPRIAPLWLPPLAYSSASLDPVERDYFERHGNTFIPGMTDVRIEWTDGEPVDLGADGKPNTFDLGADGTPNTGDFGEEDMSLRWFGLKPHQRTVPDLSNPDNIPYVAVARENILSAYDIKDMPIATPDDLRYGNLVEWSDPLNGAPASDASYRAVWRRDTWDLRPKALRFTFRIYDNGNHLENHDHVDLNEDGVPDLAAAGTPATVARYGRQFSVVVPIP